MPKIVQIPIMFVRLMGKWGRMNISNSRHCCNYNRIHLEFLSMTHVMHLRAFNMLMRNDLTYRFTELSRLESRALKIIHDFTNSVIVRRRDELLQEAAMGKKEEKFDDYGVKKKEVLIDILLKCSVNGEPLSDADIREEVDTFMFAGHDTTTAAITFGLYCIAKFPGVQDRLVKEIHEVIGEDRDTPITMHMLNNLHYLDLVLKEAQRMYPSVPLFGRLMEEDIEISELIGIIKGGICLPGACTFPHLDNVKIPAGCNVIVASIFLHNDPEWYPNPEEFRPERFLEAKETNNNNPYCYIPFSAGENNIFYF